ncbi:RHS repeat domain-containing protein [Planctomicrobium piriforme]|uniref:RHS repeat-associated core domain-containing protein n=1 Tax=Planctomicrobium piriforme TaxID=1576369 RepID=A0A1I3SFS7_9PLAN|nr:RHS repeat-associated core domain-containing protein [Planctomicrobium piriforme]SFJ57618.1 RHS repeat-associated core domain-containing protein [Planctomicrobium piriforme]
MDTFLDQVYRLTSFDQSDPVGGTILNQVTRVYNEFQQVIGEYQSHSGAVVLGTTPKVQYGYSTSSANTIRPLSMTYPNGRIVRLNYGSTGTANNLLSRPLSVVDDAGSVILQTYSYLGLNTPVIADNPQPDVRWTLVGSSNDPDTGDIYTGLDRFGRIKDCRWQDYGASADAVRLKYGYDRDSNRLWRQDDVARAASQPFDELYTYDGLQRLQTMQRGTLNSGHTAISSQTYGQCWNLDSTENWTGMKQAVGGSSWTLEQARTANTVNEITDITNSVGSAWTEPVYDGVGNMTTIPQPNDPTKSFTGTWDAWNRLVKLVDDSTTNTVEEYQYDAAGRRIVKKLYTSGTLSETRQIYLSSQNQVLEEGIGSSTEAVLQNVWSLMYIDGLILRDRDTDGDEELDERRYCLQDANWNAVALTDASGDVTQRFCYQPYGTVQFLAVNYSSGSNTALWATLFTGRELDLATGLYYFRARYLSSLVGAFMGRDPAGFADGPNFYSAYFVPTTSDPSGKQSSFVPGPFGGRLPPSFAKWFNDNKQTDGCVYIDVEDFLKWYKEAGGVISHKQVWAIWEGGCIGLAGAAATCPANIYPYKNPSGGIQGPSFPTPERLPGVRCFLQRSEAERRTCPDGEINTVFGKSGYYSGGKGNTPDIGDGGTVSPSSVVGVERNGDFFYQLEGGGLFWFINNARSEDDGRRGRLPKIWEPSPDGFVYPDPNWTPGPEIPRYKQQLTICEDSQSFSKHPDTIWCSVCKKCE